MSTYADRLAALREQLKADRLDGFVVPLTDEHMSEYVGTYAQRLRMADRLRGLGRLRGGAARGSGDLRRRALHAAGPRARSTADQWSYQSVPETSIADWLKEHAPEGARIGYDPWLHSRDWVRKASEALAARGAELVAVKRNPIDAVWDDRPEASNAQLIVQKDKYAGRSPAEKRTEIADWLAEAKRRRGGAVGARFDRLGVQCARRRRRPHPGRAGLCDRPCRRHRRPVRRRRKGRRRRPPASRQRRPAARSRRVRAGARATQRQDRRGRSRARGRRDLRGARKGRREDPRRCATRRSCPRRSRTRPRSPARRARAGPRRRGDQPLPQMGRGGGAQGRARRTRPRPTTWKRCAAKIAELKDLSFDTISGAGPNGAIVHYQSSREDQPQARDRHASIWSIRAANMSTAPPTSPAPSPIGEPTDEMRDRFTRVLKGHIALATALFPKGTRGSQLDSFARRPLWEAGLDYAHGTGHGVGSFLSVHEGPQRISPAGSAQAGGDEPLRPGMILSNEPGYYKSGEYGIRIENLVLVVERAIDGAEKEMLGFETLTFAPIDRRLIVKECSSPRNWPGSTATTPMCWRRSGRACPAPMPTGSEPPSRRSRSTLCRATRYSIMRIHLDWERQAVPSLSSPA